MELLEEKSTRQMIPHNDEELSVPEWLRQRKVDRDDIDRALARIIFNEIYPATTYHYSRFNRYTLSRMVNHHYIGRVGRQVGLSIYTHDNIYYDERMQYWPDLTILLPKSNGYLDEIEQIVRREDRLDRVEKYGELTIPLQDYVIREIGAITLQKAHARDLVEESLKAAQYRILEKKLTISQGDARYMIDSAVRQAIDTMLYKLNFISFHFPGLNSLIEAFTGTRKAVIEEQNKKAVEHMKMFIQQHNEWKAIVTGEDIINRYHMEPYGWAIFDIMGLAATLHATNHIILEYNEKPLSLDNGDVQKVFRSRKEFGKLTLVLQ